MKVGDRVGKLWVIEEGVKLGDRVIVEGVQKVRDGQQVKPMPLDPIRGPSSAIVMSVFFIHRPILAIVVSLITVIVGTVSLAFLPVSLFPNITPPEIVVSATDPGSDAVTVEQSVATPIEQQISGVDNMNYMYSLNANSGQMKLRVNFDESTNPQTDQVLTQMRQSQASAQLPPEVVAQGVSVQKSFAAPLMLIALRSADGRYDSAFLTNYAFINLNDHLTRVPGISNVQVFGSGPYAVRIWVKPDELARFNITVPDIVTAVQQQNAVNPVGAAGGEPVPPGQEFSFMAVAKGQLVTPEQFGDIVIREQQDGGIVRIRDVARVELGSQVYATKARLNGQPSAIIALYQLPGTNSLTAADGVKKLMKTLSATFSERIGIRHLAGQYPAGDRRNSGNGQDPGGSARSSDSGGLSVPAKLARDVDPAFGCTCFVSWHLYSVSASWFLDQHSFTFWFGAGDRFGGR